MDISPTTSEALIAEIDHVEPLAKRRKCTESQIPEDDEIFWSSNVSNNSDEALAGQGDDDVGDIGEDIEREIPIVTDLTEPDVEASSSSDDEEVNQDGWIDLSECDTVEDFARVCGERFKTSQELVEYIQRTKDHRLLHFTSMFMRRPRSKLPHVNSLGDVCRLLSTSRNVLVLTGAGVSVSAGIPDFRSTTGIYQRLRNEFGMPNPTCMFDKSYFDDNPQPFFSFANELWPGNFSPTPCHRFIAMLEEKGKLLRNYSQNIDTLEQKAKISKVINCHGSFATATCVTCKRQVQGHEIEADIMSQRISRCPRCHPTLINTESQPPNDSMKAKDENAQRAQKVESDPQHSDLQQRNASPARDENDNIKRETYDGNEQVDLDENENGKERRDGESWRNPSYGVLKPDIVFFGEALPSHFFSSLKEDLQRVDLLLVIGTSLRVAPVSEILGKVDKSVPAILINREVVGQPNEFDVELLGDCDKVLAELCGMLGWEAPGIPAVSSASPVKRYVSGSVHEEGELHDLEEVEDAVKKGSVVQQGPSRFLFEGFSLSSKCPDMSDSDSDEEGSDSEQASQTASVRMPIEEGRRGAPPEDGEGHLEDTESQHQDEVESHHDEERIEHAVGGGQARSALDDDFEKVASRLVAANETQGPGSAGGGSACPAGREGPSMDMAGEMHAESEDVATCENGECTLTAAGLGSQEHSDFTLTAGGGGSQTPTEGKAGECFVWDMMASESGEG
mmetsp:Transcript_56237/g.115002  ORF Transcript_56237/g.115002 Transcript_56237/m.115002 type:complete len:736 (+) Transcript_56237:477-2684(+)|eukprot:CAMPEP_0181319554 /NCGR_PEP_ID=MMETSP1101-20121128/17637_1 /TAXON_ID=46948 /ORGANISM="Rhodomonas abbreviata, Strain Caron Lab Isolate" /LENGTH=735 /DNA_ID=CAMNT_0023427169 /DNA_START=477 /DNA_END=2684 /DNA_ORIENTATION=+